MGVEGRTVHRLIACATCPGGVSAAVPETSLMPYQHLVGAEYVTVRYQALLGVEVLIQARSLSALDSRTGGFPLVRVRFTFRRAG